MRRCDLCGAGASRPRSHPGRTVRPGVRPREAAARQGDSRLTPTPTRRSGCCRRRGSISACATPTAISTSRGCARAGSTGCSFRFRAPSDLTGPPAVKKAMDLIDAVREAVRTHPKDLALATTAADIRGGPFVSLGRGVPGQEDRRDGKLVGGDRPEVVGQDGRLLGGSGRLRREALGELAPATHAGMVYRARDGAETVVPGGTGRLRGLPPGTRRGTSRRSSAGTRPEIAGWRGTRRPNAARGDRALLRGPGPGHGRAGHGRPEKTTIGSSGRARSASSMATTDPRSTTSPSAGRMLGPGLGAESTQLIVDHAFGTLGLAGSRCWHGVERTAHPRLPALRLVIEGRFPRVSILARTALVDELGSRALLDPTGVRDATARCAVRAARGGTPGIRSRTCGTSSR